VQSALYALYLLPAAVFALLAYTTLVGMLDAWRTPEALDGTRFPSSGKAPRHSFSLILPARHEQAVLQTTLVGLARLDHPDVEILVVIGHDDPETMEVAQRCADRLPGTVRVVVDRHWPKNKAKALNSALPHCRNEIVGVFDAEDQVHPLLLRRVDECFQVTGADIVQGGTQLMNFESSWYSVRNVLEYYFWFKSRLHFHARKQYVPLGGNTVFIFRRLLESAGGWDPDCLAEDCELGTRLSARGARTVVAYDPALVTREETPHTLGDLLRQRTRWNQGFLQVLRKGEWRRLPAGQRTLAFCTLAMPFFQALAGTMISVAIATTLLVDVPVLLTLTVFFPLIPMLTIVAVEMAALGLFCQEYQRRARPRDYFRLVLGTVPYHLILTAAAVRSVVRELRGVNSWEKTPHAGLHFRTE
jgi:cellulose synthase/poly-beta-1,6-N-acetylglucosamine synthase-like glycosyltransferase